MMWWLAIPLTAVVADQSCCLAIVDDVKDVGSCWTNIPGQGWTNNGYIDEAACAALCADVSCGDGAGKGDSKDGDSKEDSKGGDSKDGDSKDGDSKDGDPKDGDSKDGDSKG